MRLISPVTLCLKAYLRSQQRNRSVFVYWSAPSASTVVLYGSLFDFCGDDVDVKTYVMFKIVCIFSPRPQTILLWRYFHFPIWILLLRLIGSWSTYWRYGNQDTTLQIPLNQLVGPWVCKIIFHVEFIVPYWHESEYIFRWQLIFSPQM